MIRVNPLHPKPSLFLYGLLVSFKCFSILVNYYFQVSFNLKVILCMGKIPADSLALTGAFNMGSGSGGVCFMPEAPSGPILAR